MRSDSSLLVVWRRGSRTGLSAVSALLLALAITGTPAPAEEITLAFKGVVVDGSLAEFPVGTQISGTYTFDSLTIDESLDPRVGRYGPLLDLSYTTGAYSGRLGAGESRIQIQDFDPNGFDLYEVVAQQPLAPDASGFPARSFAISLFDSTATAFDSDELPLNAPSLADFDPYDATHLSSSIVLNFTTGPTSSRDVPFQLTSLIPLLKGDANLDGTINVLDAIRLQNMIVGKQTMSANPCLDANGDGAVNVLDAIRIHLVIVELLPKEQCAPGECAGFARFLDGGSTVFDCQTRLDWEKKTPDNMNDRYTWSDGSPWDPDGTAFTEFLPGLDGLAGVPACTTTSECTSEDGVTVTCTTPPPDGCWRLPESDELQTILSEPFPCSTSPCIDPVFGPTPPPSRPYYWSATSDANPRFAWMVNYEDGFVSNGASKDVDVHVRAVRSGAVKAARFVDRGLTVFDRRTGFEWEKKTDDDTVHDLDNRYFGNEAPDGFTRVKDFLQGLNEFAGGPACTTTSDCTSSDGKRRTCTTPPPTGCWRLPEIDELQKILDLSRCEASEAPCIDPVFGPTETPAYYYSVTCSGSCEETSTSVWRLSFTTGHLRSDPEFTGGHLRAVRSSP